MAFFSALDFLSLTPRTEPIPEDTTGYEGYDNYGQSGEAWQTEGTSWQDYPQGDQWAHQPGPQAEVWDTGQYPQQEWRAPTTSPAPVDAPTPPGPSAFAAWGRNPQGVHGTPQPPHMAQHPPSAAPPGPPPGVPPSRSRQDSGLPPVAPSWHKWSAEAMANNKQVALPPSQPPGTGYGQQGRVTFASHDSYVPFVSRDENTPQAQQMIFDSIMNSRGGAPAPRQPQQRSARGSAQNSMHSTKHSKKSKKEKRVQEQSPHNAWDGQQQGYGWGQENPGFEQDNSQWGKEGYGWDQQQEADWGEKQDPAWDQWPSGEAGRDGMESEGYTDSEGWNVTGRRKTPQYVSNTFLHALAPESPYPVSSRTMAYANGTVPPPVDAPSPVLSRRSNTINDYTNIESLESFGEALRPVEGAFFGQERKARDRIHWQFPHEKDERVRNALEWLHDHTRSVASFGVSFSRSSVSFSQRTLFS